MNYVSLEHVCSDHTSLQVHHCDANASSVVIWVHGGGWVAGDRRRVRSMPGFFNKNNILLISINYPLRYNGGTPLIEVQLNALKGLNEWLTENSLIDRYANAFNNIAILAHSSGAHLVALADKTHGWNKAVSTLFLMDSSAYDLESRYLHARQKVRRHFDQLLSLQGMTTQESLQILRNYSPALLSTKPHHGSQRNIIIVTSQRPGALYSAQMLEKSYQVPGYNPSVVKLDWSHEYFPAAIGENKDIDQLILSSIRV